MTFTKDTSGPYRLAIRGTRYHTVRVITVQNVDSTSSSRSLEQFSSRKRGGRNCLSVVFRREMGCSRLAGDLNVQIFPILDLTRTKLDRDPGQGAQEVVQSSW